MCIQRFRLGFNFDTLNTQKLKVGSRIPLLFFHRHEFFYIFFFRIDKEGDMNLGNVMAAVIV